MRLPVGGTKIQPSVDSFAYAPLCSVIFLQKPRSGYFIQDQISIGDRWDILTSARRVSYRPYSTYSLSINSEPLDKWRYRLGVTYQVEPGISTYASYSQGISNNVGYPTRNGSALAPVEAEQLETGAKFAFYDKRLCLNLSSCSRWCHLRNRKRLRVM
ncbi:hypothetical protein PEC302110_23040 [Pectobacterium araliae]|uniref:TonB-dependent receptor-like beta-barrel domain-containing protein n=1 Tax=Pectobacterium araliae TaxID=3073862 RepID=A0AAN0KAW0_9GAMM|nr:hypothetical protein PEC302110_23040 [Pectobacterium sp. MAFF 302110]